MATSDDLAETVAMVEKLDRRAVMTEADVRDLGAISSAVQAGVAELGRLDIVVANAGIMSTLGEIGDTDDAFYQTIDVNLTGVWHTLRATVPTLIEQGAGGSIVITSSTAGLRGLMTPAEAGSDAYAASKHAVVGLMRVFSNRLAKHNIRVNTVHPTGVNSPMIMNEAFGAFVAEYPEIAGQMQNTLPVQLIEPEDIANAVAWLVSEDARYVTGVTLPVDAGFTNRA